MKLKDGIIITKTAGTYYLVDSSAGENRFGGMAKLSRTAGFIASEMKKETSEKDIIDKYVSVFGVSSETAKRDIEKTKSALAEIGVTAE